MDSVLQELHRQFVVVPHRDAFPEDTARNERRFRDTPLSLRDAKDNLVYNASLTGFQEGLRLGLLLALELPRL